MGGVGFYWFFLSTGDLDVTSYIPARMFVLLIATLCSPLMFPVAAEAACVRNDTHKTLYVIMTSTSGKLEQTFQSGSTICQSVPKGTQTKVNILPFGGARFGCRTDIDAEQTVGLDQFSTMNKCHFQQN